MPTTTTTQQPNTPQEQDPLHKPVQGHNPYEDEHYPPLKRLDEEAMNDKNEDALTQDEYPIHGGK